MSADVRLQKFLAQAGLCSRRAGERWITEGRVSVNGRVVTTLGTRVDPASDTVQVDGRSVTAEATLVTVALHKPKGVVSSRHHRGEPVVVDLVNVPQRVVPIGRLDKDSTGLLLLTNNGPLHHQLTHPSFDHEKEYRVITATPIATSALDQMATGLSLDDGRTRPARVERLGRNRFSIVLKEGRNRQIRRMVAAVGNRVTGLHRIRFAGISIGSLPSGQWRHLRGDEIKRLSVLATSRRDRRKHGSRGR